MATRLPASASFIGIQTSSRTTSAGSGMKSARLIIAIAPVMPGMPRKRDSCPRIQRS